MAVLSNWMAQARHLEAAGDLRAAVAIYQEALAKQEETAGFADLSLYNGLGDLYLRAGRKADALKAYEDAAQHCEDQQLYANGIALCKKILRNAPDHAPAYRRAARLSALSGLEAEARLHYGRYRKHLGGNERGVEALESLQEIVEITADEESSVELAEAFAELGDLDRALELLRAVKARRQDEGRAVVILVRTIQELQQGAQIEDEYPQLAGDTSAQETLPVPSEATRAESAIEQVVAPESFAELDTSEFGYTLLPDVEAEAIQTEGLDLVSEPVVAPEDLVEPEAVAEPEDLVELQAIVEPEDCVGHEPTVEAESTDSQPAGRFSSILEELDDEFSDTEDQTLGGPWETGSTRDPSLGAFGSTSTADVGSTLVPSVERTPAVEEPSIDKPVIEETPSETDQEDDGASDADPMTLLFDRLDLVMSRTEGEGSLRQALAVIDEMLSIEPGRFELLSRKLYYAFAIPDEAAAVSAYLALGESLDRRLDGFTVRTLSSSTGAGSVTAAIQVEDVPGLAPGT